MINCVTKLRIHQCICFSSLSESFLTPWEEVLNAICYVFGRFTGCGLHICSFSTIHR